MEIHSSETMRGLLIQNNDNSQLILVNGSLVLFLPFNGTKRKGKMHVSTIQPKDEPGTNEWAKKWSIEIKAQNLALTNPKWDTRRATSIWIKTLGASSCAFRLFLICHIEPKWCSSFNKSIDQTSAHNFKISFDVILTTTTNGTKKHCNLRMWFVSFDKERQFPMRTTNYS